MAIFKVGDRVKRVAQGPGLLPIPMGTTGTVIGDSMAVGRTSWTAVAWDAALSSDCRDVFTNTLAPLTDGESDAWAADAVRKVVKPQHTEPVAPKVKEPQHSVSISMDKLILFKADGVWCNGQRIR